jgi:hypothetical protein
MALKLVLSFVTTNVLVRLLSDATQLQSGIAQRLCVVHPTPLLYIMDLTNATCEPECWTLGYTRHALDSLFSV